MKMNLHVSNVSWTVPVQVYVATVISVTRKKKKQSNFNVDSPSPSLKVMSVIRKKKITEHLQCFRRCPFPAVDKYNRPNF
jgi:hypothetical protein